MKRKLTIFTDGGGQAGDNVGGDAASAYVVKEGDSYLGSRSIKITGTNNDAEYTGVRLAVEHLASGVVASQDEIESVTFFSDSQLIAYQLSGRWGAKEDRMRAHRDYIRKVVATLPFPVEFTWGRREHNKEADSLVAYTMEFGDKTDFEAPLPADPRKKGRAPSSKRAEKTGPKSLSLVQVLNMANAVYDDGYLAHYFDESTGRLDPEGDGDTLAKFIVMELGDVLDTTAAPIEQILAARQTLTSAARQLLEVASAIGRPDLMQEAGAL